LTALIALLKFLKTLLCKAFKNHLIFANAQALCIHVTILDKLSVFIERV
jgi:hypothetical protein